MLVSVCEPMLLLLLCDMCIHTRARSPIGISEDAAAVVRQRWSLESIEQFELNEHTHIYIHRR